METKKTYLDSIYVIKAKTPIILTASSSNLLQIHYKYFYLIKKGLF